MDDSTYKSYSLDWLIDFLSFNPNLSKAVSILEIVDFLSEESSDFKNELE